MIAYRNILTSLLFLAMISVTTVSGQSIKRIGTSELEKILGNPDDNLFVVNFWATWCGPCIKELPHFEKLSKEYQAERVTFILVSLDFPSEIDKKLIPFLKKNKIDLGVYVMMDLDYDTWIGKVDEGWQGNLPATLVFNNTRGIRQFLPREIDESTLREIIRKNI